MQFGVLVTKNVKTLKKHAFCNFVCFSITSIILEFQHFGITTHQNGESHNTLNWETIQPYQMHVF